MTFRKRRDGTFLHPNGAPVTDPSLHRKLAAAEGEAKAARRGSDGPSSSGSDDGACDGDGGD